MRSIYVAGASAELDLVDRYVARLRAGGWRVTLDWCAIVRDNGGPDRSNMVDSAERARAIATADLDAVAEADVFWLVVPAAPSIGCWVKIGVACAARALPCGGRPHPTIIISADRGQTIFTALADVAFPTHDEALAHLLALVRGG